MSLYYRICTPERITKGTRHESAGFFLLKRLKFILKSNLKGKIQQLQSSWGSMLGMSLYYRICTPERITKGTRHESAGFLLKRLKFILKSNLKGKIQQLQSSWGSMLGMNLYYLPIPIRGTSIVLHELNITVVARGGYFFFSKCQFHGTMWLVQMHTIVKTTFS